MMRATAEILNRIEELKDSDFFGVTTSDLIDFLPFDDAREMYKDDLSDEEIAEIKANILIPTKKNVLAKMKDYLLFAWEKANSKRGLSANRSIDHMRAYLWLLGDDVLQGMESIEYEHYGKEQLIYCSELCGFNWQEHDNGDRVN
jgi:hypothetical protein